MLRLVSLTRKRFASGRFRPCDESMDGVNFRKVFRQLAEDLVRSEIASMSDSACYRQSRITAGLQSVARGCGVIRFSAMREHVIQIVEKYIDAVRSNDASELPLHPDVVCEFPTNTYRGAASFRQGLDQFALIMKSIDVIRLVVDGEHCVAIVNIDTVFGLIPFAEHIHVSNGEIVSIRGYCDPRPMLSGANTSA